MEDKYTTITDRIGEGFYSEKRSKFLAFAHHVETHDQVKKLLSSYKTKYYDARHVCSAYIIGPNADESKANDDGEPSSTAGKPILGQIVSAGLTNVLVVVVRYYGGVNLGTGGLIVAYRTAAADAISSSEKVEKYMQEDVEFSFPYVMMNGVMRVVKTMEPHIVSQEFDNTCKIVLRIRKSLAAELKSRLEALAYE